MRSHPLKTILIFVAVIGLSVLLINFAIKQWRPHPDFDVSQQKMIVDANHLNKTYDTTNKPWIEITFVKDNKLTLQVHAGAQNITFVHGFSLWKVSKNDTTNAVKVKEIVAGGAKDYDAKSFSISANEESEATINCGLISELAPGSYVLETNDMFLYFTLVEYVNDNNFFDFDLGGIFKK